MKTGTVFFWVAVGVLLEALFVVLLAVMARYALSQPWWLAAIEAFVVGWIVKIWAKTRSEA